MFLIKHLSVEGLYSSKCDAVQIRPEYWQINPRASKVIALSGIKQSHKNRRQQWDKQQEQSGYQGIIRQKLNTIPSRDEQTGLLIISRRL